jgi:cellulose synthase/poly-beta-1,6-N-acetylglucosamine synthase-like glycosyltransferase
MYGFVLTVSLALAGLSLYQIVLTAIFFVRNRRASAHREPVGRASSLAVPDVTPGCTACPKAAVLLALRGADPHLALGLKRLMQQDYPNYELRIVVDSETDPAWDLVHQGIRETGATNVRVGTLRERSAQCSLHCASLVQLAGELDESTELFVLADGDIVAHASWLSELVTPIIRDEADATSGNRWYMPPQGRFGSIVRYVWNAAAVVSMYFLAIPWGGTLAGRTRDLRRSGLIDKWRKGLAVDAPICECWRKLGLDIGFVPSLMMINREECDLTGSFIFVSRQLLWTRLYQPRPFWRSVVMHAFVMPAMLLANLGFSLYGILAGSGGIAAAALASLAVYLTTTALSLLLLELRVRSIARQQNNAVTWMSSGVPLKLVCAVLVTPMIHLLAVVHVLVKRKLHWRGVVYDIRSAFDIRKIDDRPLRPSDQPADPAHSI